MARFALRWSVKGFYVFSPFFDNFAMFGISGDP